jgi:hypothetical protein
MTPIVQSRNRVQKRKINSRLGNFFCDPVLKVWDLHIAAELGKETLSDIKGNTIFLFTDLSHHYAN